MGEDGLWYYKCITCEQFQPEYDFHNNRNKPFGIDVYCKMCKKENHRPTQTKLLTQINKQYGTSWIEPTGRHLNLKGLTKEDEKYFKEFLTKMDYDLSQPVHLQFQKRIEDKYGVILDMDDIPYQEKEDNGL